MNGFEDYSDAIKHKNRFIVDEKYTSFFENFIENNTVVFECKHRMYRARINELKQGSEPYQDEDIGMPPKHVVSSEGRANPIGIRYYYLASDEMTCISEVRPSIDDYVTVATVEALENLKLVELDYIVSVSSANIDDPENEVMNVIEFMTNMSRGFSKPIKGEEGIEYAPYQYFAEYCKNKGRDGIKFQSSVMPNSNNQWGKYGTEQEHYNYVLFTDEKTKIVGRKAVLVKKVEYGYHEVDG